MPNIDIQHPHRLSLSEARAAVEQVAGRLREKFGLDNHWHGDTLQFSRPGVKGLIAVGADRIRVQAELGLLLTPLKATVEQEIRRKLDEQFG